MLVDFSRQEEQPKLSVPEEADVPNKTVSRVESGSFFS